MKEIVITIDADGNARAEGRGMKGKECDRFMKPIEDALGVVASRENKPEYFAHEPASVKVGQR